MTAVSQVACRRDPSGVWCRADGFLQPSFRTQAQVERHFQAFPSHRKYIGLKRNCFERKRNFPTPIFIFFSENVLLFFLGKTNKFLGLRENNTKFTQYSGKSKYLSFHHRVFAKRIFFASVSATEVLVVEIIQETLYFLASLSWNWPFCCCYTVKCFFSSPYLYSTKNFKQTCANKKMFRNLCNLMHKAHVWLTLITQTFSTFSNRKVWILIGVSLLVLSLAAYIVANATRKLLRAKVHCKEG